MSEDHNNSAGKKEDLSPLNDVRSEPEVPSFSDTSSGNAEESGSSENSRNDILHLYFREMGSLPQMTAEEEASLWKKMDGILEEIRKAVTQFGFVYEEITAILSNGEQEDLGDIFRSRSDASIREMADGTEALREQKKQFFSLHEELQAQFLRKKRSGKELRKLREKGVALFDLWPVLPGKVLEWLEAGRQYAAMLDAGTISADWVRERVLMEEEEFRAIVNQCLQRHAEYDQMKVRMVESNLKLVIKIAQRYQGKGLPLSDLIQEGNIGLMKALEKFDCHLGHRFCTYASWWIKQGVARALSAQTRTIRLPMHMVTTIRKMRIAEKNYIQKNGTEPSDEEIAGILEMPPERIRAIRKMAHQCISLQAPTVEGDEDTILQNFLSDREQDDPIRSYAGKQMRSRLAEALSRLTEREKIILSLRYGLQDDRCRSLGELSQSFHITRERVRQIELRALEKLRKNSRSGAMLDDYFLT